MVALEMIFIPLATLKAACRDYASNWFLMMVVNLARLAPHQFEKGGVIFGYWVRDQQRYGVVGFDANGNVIGIEEKPAKPKSNYAVPGLYFFDQDVVSIASSLKPSARGKLEIVDVIDAYLNRGQLKVELLGRGFAWLDTGTHESFLEANLFIETIQKR
jgi:glucose-1-phosphate thymidylyltransferase